ncbi:response regulator [Candidatus Woesearchaeota archaeon]|nr:response regulator [Candidatus Woesearchaeota archaeon]
MVKRSELEERAGILIIDDEPHNVEALIEFLERRGIEVQYTSDLAEGAETISEAYKEGRTYSAIVCDNHFPNSGLEKYDPNFNGIDLVSILSKNSRDLPQDRGHRQFVKDYFGRDLGGIRREYRGKIVMFSGSAYSESSEIDSSVEIVQKFPDTEGVCCESGVLDVLEGLGLDLEGREDSELLEYKERNDLCYGLPSDDERILGFY